ncbi:vesicular transport protein [Apiospora arundinis]
MFQRFKSALDKSIAEEQARQKTIAEQRSNNASPASNSRPQSVSRTNSSAAKRKTKKPSQDVGNGADNLPNTDPAVFEAAFALDDEEAEEKAAVAKPENGEVSEKDVKGDNSTDAASNEKTEGKETTENEKAEPNGDDKKKTAAAPAKAAELPP